jgi:hypothetical protein
MRQWWTRQSLAATDAWLYGVSSVFALGVGVYSTQSAEWHWGFLAFGPFALGCVLALAGRSLGELAQRYWRVAILTLVAIGVVAIPLVYETTVRPLAQPEVGVIVRAADEVLKDKTVYPAYWSNGHVVNAVPGIRPALDFFPYMPLMAAFGIPAALTGRDTGLTDARVTMTLFTGVLMLLALLLLRAPTDRKLRTAQLLVVLPTGSLFLATGGDDMPILALCLMALVAMQRRSVWWTGILLGVACAMKLTAWPLALAVFAVSRDVNDRPSGRRVAAIAGTIVGVTIAPFVLAGPHGFVANVIEFPLGLAGVSSWAASPLPGHLLTNWQPWLSHVIMPAVFLIGSVVLWRFLRPRWPLSPPLALRTMAVAMTVVICAATATRIGYLIYPLNFMLWAWVLTPQPDSVDRVVLEEVQSPSR